MRLILIIAVVLLAGCGGERSPLHTVDYNEMFDLTPPELLGARVVSAQQAEYCFQEEVTLDEQSVAISNEIALDGYEQSDCGIVLTFDEPLLAGQEYVVALTVSDDNGNSLDIVSALYGYNGNLPEIVINEFTTQGSSSRPDMVELYVVAGGNLAGMTIYEGTASDWDQRKIFPDVDVTAGSYALVHFKPEGIAEEVDEIVDMSASGGTRSHGSAWDYWVEAGSGLSGNNGVVTLYSSPIGEMVDAVIYSNRTSDSDEKYRGFGRAAVMARVDEIVAAGGWVGAGDLLTPEETVYSGYTTSTRSMGRSSTSIDSDSADDWHTVPTSGSTFGEANSDEKHEP